MKTSTSDWISINAGTLYIEILGLDEALLLLCLQGLIFVLVSITQRKKLIILISITFGLENLRQMALQFIAQLRF
ncbi:hypothetical protein AWS29_11705 [Enterobacter hormaechei subsp. steigerwaltii]|nr:hypothetical protein AWS29_11705 [Enterobacter hormaechei subsp. steigerwaltii]